MKTRHQLRCVCSRKPLLALYGLDHNSKVYLHIRVYKANKIYGEVLVQEGTISIRCRDCLRWQQVVVSGRTASLTEVTSALLDQV